MIHSNVSLVEEPEPGEWSTTSWSRVKKIFKMATIIC